MSLGNDVRADIRSAQTLRLPRWGVLLIIIVSLPIYWFFEHFGKLSIALPILNFVAVLSFAVVVKRRFRHHAWFWITMTILVALHVVLILVIPWGTRWVPALVIAGIDSADLCLIFCILAMVGRLVNRPRLDGV